MSVKDNGENTSFQRLKLLIGKEALTALSKTKVIVFGLGGVGSWCAEALVRSGVGHISLVDFDVVDITNINRQVEATSKTIGQVKTQALAARLKEINPDCAVVPINRYFSRRDEHGNICSIEDTAGIFGIPDADYIIDAIDSLESKLDLIESARVFGRVLYSSMGMARKLDPARIKTDSIWKTRGCPLARNVREGLRRRGFTGDFTAVYSEEKPLMTNDAIHPETYHAKKIIGSAVTVTAAAGMILAGLVINDIHKKQPLNGNPEHES